MGRLWPFVLPFVSWAGCFVHFKHTPHWDAASSTLCRKEVCYRVGALGEDWQPVHKEDAAIGFFNEKVGGVISSSATCRDDADAAPLTSLTEQMFIGYTDRHVERQETVRLDERDALRTRATAKLDGVPVSLDLYVLKRNGCIFDLSYAGPLDRARSGSADFQRFVGGFADARKK